MNPSLTPTYILAMAIIFIINGLFICTIIYLFFQIEVQRNELKIHVEALRSLLDHAEVILKD